MNGIFSFQGLYREATCPLLKQAVSLSSDRGVGGTQPSKRAASSGASPEAPPRRDVLYINKWYTFAACALLQLLMGVQYCFPCAPSPSLPCYPNLLKLSLCSPPCTFCECRYVPKIFRGSRNVDCPGIGTSKSAA